MEQLTRLPYSSMMILNPDDKKNFSPIYSSQSYQTFYQVYARFDVDKVSSDSKKMKLNSIDFELVNFKGPFQLGIKKIDVKSLPIEGEDSQRVLFIKIYVKVATSRRPLLNYEIDADDILDEELRYISHNDILFVDRELLSIYGSTHEEVPEYNVTNDESTYKGIFDIEFYARNGKDSIFKRERAKEIKDVIQINDTNASFTGGGGQLCYSSKSTFVIV